MNKKNFAPINEQMDLIKRGAVEFIPEDELVQKLERSIKENKLRMWGESRSLWRIITCPRFFCYRICWTTLFYYGWVKSRYTKYLGHKNGSIWSRWQSACNRGSWSTWWVRSSTFQHFYRSAFHHRRLIFWLLLPFCSSIYCLLSLNETLLYMSCPVCIFAKTQKEQ